MAAKEFLYSLTLDGGSVTGGEFALLTADDLPGVYQPLDATLTAFAALTIAANSLTIGTGADAFSQTTFAANTFPARASSGNLVAKTITDFGLSLVDDADAATARTTLGLGTAAVQNMGTSGATVPFLNGINHWGDINRFPNSGVRILDATGNWFFGISVDEFQTKDAYLAIRMNTASLGIADHRTLDMAGDLTILSSATISGTNSGDLALAGENYLTISSQTVTAHAVDLSGTNATGTLAAGRFPALTGDVTTVAGALATTISANAVTLSMMATMATASFLGRNTAGTGNVEVLSEATAKTMLNLTGTNSGDQTITLTGDVTGSGTGSFAATIASAAVTYAKMQDISAASRLLGRGSAAGSGAPQEVSLGSGLAMTGTTLSATGSGGTVTSVNLTAPAAGITVSGGPITTSGSITLALANDLAAVEGLAANGIATRTATDTWTVRTITGTADNLTVTNGDGVSGNPTLRVASTYAGQSSIVSVGTLTAGATGAGFTVALSTSTITGTLPAAQMPALTGDVTTSAGAVATTISANAVTLSMMAQMATASFLGRNTASTGNVEVLSEATVKTMLNLTGTNSGDQTITLTGGVTGSGTGSFAATVVTNANLTGNVTSVGNATTIAAGVVTNAMLAGSIDLTTKVTGILPSANGGTANGFTKFSGPASSEKTFTLPNASSTILTDNALVTAAQGGTANGFFAVSGPASSTKTFTFPNASSTVLTSNAAVTVAQGGTGVATLTAHGILLGEGAGNIVPTAAMTDGQLLVGQTSADPLPKTITGDVTITAAGATAIASHAVSSAKFRQSAGLSVVGVIGSSTADVADITAGAANQVLRCSSDATSIGFGSIDASVIGSGTMLVARGGTGIASYTSGDLLYASGSTTLSQRAIGASGYVLMANPNSPAAPQWSPLPRQNLLYNGDFRIAQRQTSFTSSSVPAVNNDATYTLDTWILLAEANNSVNVAQSTTSPPTGSYCSVSLTVNATNNNKFGFATYLEARDTGLLAGNSVSLQFKAKVTGTTIGTIRVGIVQWTGTADAPTRDLVSVWGAAGTNPTLVTSWAFANTPADLATSTSWTTYKVENIAISASATNVGVFIWNDDKTTTAADILWLADVKLEIGDLCTETWDRLPVEQELARCQRYYVQLGGTTGQRYYGGRSQATNNAEMFYKTPVTMRATPTLGLVGSNFNTNDNAVNVTISSLGTSFSSPDALACNCNTSAATLTANRALFFSFTDTVSFLTATAEL